MTAYVIRPAQSTDLPHLPSIEKAAAQLFRESTEAFIADDEGISLGSFEEHFAHDKVWVAVYQRVAAEEELVGFAVARKLDGKAYLHEIDIHPDHGRRGLDRRLIEAVTDWARQESLPTITLSTFRDIPWNAPYYAKLGFQPLTDDDLEPGFRDVRVHEAEAGLDINRRVCMILPLP